MGHSLSNRMPSVSLLCCEESNRSGSSGSTVSRRGTHKPQRPNSACVVGETQQLIPSQSSNDFRQGGQFRASTCSNTISKGLYECCCCRNASFSARWQGIYNTICGRGCSGVSIHIREHIVGAAKWPGAIRSSGGLHANGHSWLGLAQIHLSIIMQLARQKCNLYTAMGSTVTKLFNCCMFVEQERGCGERR